MFLKSDGKIKNREIARSLGENERTVGSWKRRDSWLQQLEYKKKKKNCGAQPGNKNTVGNSGGAPLFNNNALKHGLYKKKFPPEVYEEYRPVFERIERSMQMQGILK